MKSLSLFLLFAPLMLAAQPQSGGAMGVAVPKPGSGTGSVVASGNSSISGVLIDSLSQEPIPYAAIALFPVGESQPVNGAIANADGRFLIEQIAAGTYRLQISSVGFGSKTLDGVLLDKNQDLNLGMVYLASKVTTLDEVVISSQQSLIEEKVDRLVYNAEADIATKGRDAADVLRKVPMLSVDLEGNVQLRGSSNIRVLINNKPSTIVASSVADALKMIPGDQIKSVEVITSPSAKYDAEGSGGIINIITKKTTLEGYNLNVDTELGNRASSFGLNGGYRQGKLGITVGGRSRVFYNPAETTTEQSTLVNGITQSNLQQINAFDRGLFGGFNVGMDYDLSKSSFLTGSARYGVRNFGTEQDQTSDQFENGVPVATSFREVTTKNNAGNFDGNLDYLKVFKPSQELSFSTQYSVNNLTNNYSAAILDAVSDVNSRERNLNLNRNQEITAQSDFTTPIKDNQVFEVGAKAISRQVTSDYTYQLAYGANGEYINNPNRASDVLDYTQNIGGAYFTYTYSTPSKFTAKVGARYEFTNISAALRTSGAFEIPNYANLLPSINLSQPLKAGMILKAAYNRRIQRPGLSQLNPNFNAANPLNISIGNPTLSPEYTDNFELAYSMNLKKTYVNVSTFARLTNNAIQQVRLPSDTLLGGVITTFQNIGKEQTYGVNIFANVYLTPRWTINGGGDIFYSYLQGQTVDAQGAPVTVTNSGVNVTGRIMTQVTFNKGWSAQAFAFTRGSQVQLQGRQGSWYHYEMAFKKDFNDRKGSVGLVANNFLQRGTLIRTNLESALFTQSSEVLRLNRSFQISFSYKFGKLNFEENNKKTRSIKNEDIKAGDAAGGNG